MEVTFVDRLCISSYFTDLENLLLRADVGQKKTASKFLGLFPDPDDACGPRAFQVIGRCLSLTHDDNSVIVNLNASDEKECLTPGLYQGSLIINFDHVKNGQSIINFNYALDCNPGLELEGSAARVHDYIQGGPNLNISLGTWTAKSECGGLVSSNLKDLDKNPKDWFKFDQTTHQLHVFGLPKNYADDHF